MFCKFFFAQHFVSFKSAISLLNLITTEFQLIVSGYNFWCESATLKGLFHLQLLLLKIPRAGSQPACHDYCHSERIVVGFSQVSGAGLGSLLVPCVLYFVKDPCSQRLQRYQWGQIDNLPEHSFCCNSCI